MTIKANDIRRDINTLSELNNQKTVISELSVMDGPTQRVFNTQKELAAFKLCREMAENLYTEIFDNGQPR